MDALGPTKITPGGNKSNYFLENMIREQTTLGNLEPGQRFSLADQKNSIRAILAAADDDDDEDIFKEFDVEDLDIAAPGDTDMPLGKSSSGQSNEVPKATGVAEAADASDPAEKDLNEAGPATPHPNKGVQRPASAAEAASHAQPAIKTASSPVTAADSQQKPSTAAPAQDVDSPVIVQEAEAFAADCLTADAAMVVETTQCIPAAQGHAESEAALQEDSLIEHPQEALHADEDEIMQDADDAVENPAQDVGQEEPSDQQTRHSEEPPQKHDEVKDVQPAAFIEAHAEGCTMAPDADMADLHAPTSAAQESPAPIQATQHTPSGAQASEAAHSPHWAAKIGTASLLQQHAGASGAGLSAEKLPAKSGLATVSGGHSGVTHTLPMRSASAGSMPDNSPGARSAMRAEQKAGQMHSAAAGILSKASAARDPAAFQPQTGPIHTAAAAPVLSKPCAVQLPTSQMPDTAAGRHTKASASATLATAELGMFPGPSSQQKQVATPSMLAPSPVQGTVQAADMPRKSPAAAAAEKHADPAAASEAAPAALGGQPGHSWSKQGGLAINLPLQARLFPSPLAASCVKAPARVLPMPRTALSRLPQIIRVNAPARPQLPECTTPAAAKHPVPSANPVTKAGASPTAGVEGVVTPVQSSWAGIQAAGSTVQNRSQPTQSLQQPLEATLKPGTAPMVSTTPMSITGAPSTQQQAPGGAALGTTGTQGTASNALSSPPAAGVNASSPAAPPPGHTEGSVGTAGSLGTGSIMGSPSQPEAGAPAQAKETSGQPAAHLELLRGQYQLKQMVLEAQRMADQALELKVMAAIVGNRLTRLNNPMLAAKLREMKQRAEQLLKRED